MPTYASRKKLYRNQTTTVQRVSDGPCVLAGWYFFNPNAVTAFVQVFDTTGTVTLGTTVPDNSFGVPATGAANQLDGSGITFTNGLKFACTTTEDGSTANASGLTVNLFIQ